MNCEAKSKKSELYAKRLSHQSPREKGNKGSNTGDSLTLPYFGGSSFEQEDDGSSTCEKNISSSTSLMWLFLCLQIGRLVSNWDCVSILQEGKIAKVQKRFD